MATAISRPRTDAFEMHIDSEVSDWVRLRIEGQMSYRCAPNDEEPLHAAFGWDTYSRRVMIDLSEVSTIDTSGLSWLMLINKRLDYFGGKLVLHSLSPVVRTLIRVLNLQAVLKIAEDEVAAEAILAGGRG